MLHVLVFRPKLELWSSSQSWITWHGKCIKFWSSVKYSWIWQTTKNIHNSFCLFIFHRVISYIYGIFKSRCCLFINRIFILKLMKVSALQIEFPLFSNFFTLSEIQEPCIKNWKKQQKIIKKAYSIPFRE